MKFLLFFYYVFISFFLFTFEIGKKIFIGCENKAIFKRLFLRW